MVRGGSVRRTTMPEPVRLHGLTEPELVAWGRAVGEQARRPLVLALRGPLGAGKSVLARAVARGAGVDGRMPSPTFNLVYRYEREGVTVLHLDLYRLEDADEVWELGWSELGAGLDEIVLIEWPERAGELLPEPRWDVRLRGAGDGLRDVEAAPVGDAPALPAAVPS